MTRNFVLPIALSAAFALAPIAAEAQVIVTARGGVNVANIDGDDVLINPDSRIGLNLGGSLTLPLSDNLGILLGAIYSQKGAKLTAEGGEATFALDYIELPALLALSFPTDGPLGARFLLGAAVAFELNCEVQASTEGVELTVGCDQPEAENEINTEAFDIGGVGGVGLTWDAGETFQLSLDVLYNLGLTSIAEDEDAKNRTFSVQAGLGFPL
jgi:hypothetical protein